MDLKDQSPGLGGLAAWRLDGAYCNKDVTKICLGSEFTKSFRFEIEILVFFKYEPCNGLKTCRDKRRDKLNLKVCCAIQGWT